MISTKRLARSTLGAMADDDTSSRVADAVLRPGQYAALPPRIALADTIAETDISVPPDDPTSDPNRDVANRWGAGLVGM